MRFASGARLGPFEILAPLGAGGMGEVYRARDTRLDRTVAIKLLPSELSAHSRKVERFRHEARAIARITHPNICTLHDVGEEASVVFLVMEYLDGVTLARRLEDGALPLGIALRTGIAVADALDHAHHSGVVHRDVKPGNIMLTRDGVKLLDFGVAKLMERDEQAVTEPTRSVQLTEAGTIVGTVPYMAPEQIEEREVDARTDIFAFGVVLYEMVCGRRPFAGNSRATLMAAILTTEPAPMTAIQQMVPPALDRLTRRCLAKEPGDRWQTARDLAAELRWIAESASTVQITDTAPRSRRVRLWSGIAAAAVITAAVCAAATWLMWPQPAVAAYQPVTFRKGVVSSARFSPDGASVVYTASWEGQPYATFLGRSYGADARDLQLKDARILSISDDGEMAVLLGPQNIERGFGVRTLARIPMAGGAQREVLTGIVDADWIPRTDTLAVIRDPGGNRPWTVEFPTGKTVHETPAAWSLRVSPDGSRVAFFEGPVLFGSPPEAMITVIDTAGRKTTIAKGWAGFGLAWAPSGKEVWFTATRPGLGAPHLYAASLTGVERTVHRAPDWLVLYDISAEGRALMTRNSIRIELACRRPGDARERDLAWLWASTVRGLSPDAATILIEDELGAAPSGNPMLLRRGMDASPAVPIGEGVDAALSPDGRWVLAALGDDLVLWPIGPGSMITLPRGNLTRAQGAAWLGDSRRIVFTGETADGKSRGYIQEIPAGLPRAITPDGVVLAAKAAVRDETMILGRSGTTWTLFPVEGGEGRPVLALTRQDIPLQWSHGGRYVYTVTAEEGARPAGVDVYRVDVATADRIPWRTLTPADPVGVENMRETLVITPDAESYCYSFLRRLGDLFVVDGLK